MSCFSKKVKPAEVQIIKGYDNLHWDNQEKIRNKVDGKPTNHSTKKKIFSLLNIFN
jgi:hypothetical protein